MKAKLTVTIDEEVIPKAKAYAKARGISLSQLVEISLREISSDGGEVQSFAERWRGRFVAADRDDERYRALVERHR